MLKHDLMLICCIFRVRDNFKIMNLLKKMIKRRQDILFCIHDALLIYFYAVLGLQADVCMNYMEYYMKFYSNPQNLLTYS